MGGQDISSAPCPALCLGGDTESVVEQVVQLRHRPQGRVWRRVSGACCAAGPPAPGRDSTGGVLNHLRSDVTGEAGRHGGCAASLRYRRPYARLPLNRVIPDPVPPPT